MNITSFIGEQLLNAENLQAIKKEADLILQNKDVAAAWQGSRHIKMQLAALPGDKVKAVLPDYRRLTANLKALSLPLLSWDEVKNLVTNNLAFLDSKYTPVLSAGLAAWFSTQTDSEKSAHSSELLKLLPNDSSLRSALSVSISARSTVDRPATPVVKIGNNEGLFDKEESAELTSHAQKVSAIGAAPILVRGASMGAADNIFALSGGSGDKETFLRRANALITSRLRDVRTKIDLREYLGRPFLVGGLGLGGDILDKASGLIEDEYNKLHSSEPKAPKPQAEMAKTVAAAVMEAPVLARPASAPPAVIKEEPIKPAIKIEPLVIKPVPEAVMPKPESKLGTEVKPVPDAQRVVRPMRTAPINDKPRVDDIKSGSRTVSAIDELKLLTIEDWRKFGAPDEAIKSILRKIQILGQHSIGDKVQGIKMFRASELFRQYLALGRATLAQGKKLTEALADKAINPDNITQDEFFTIALLNGKLK